MNFSNDTRDKIQPEPGTYDFLHLLALAIVVLQIIIAIGALPFLPSMVPAHWNAAGQVNGYASKWEGMLLFPGLSVGIYLLMRFIAVAGPKLGGRASAAANAQVRSTILVAILLFMLVVQLCVTAISFGIALNIGFVLTVALALLMIVLGNFLGKIRRNFWLGIRTPWTLSSDIVWERTHRLGGWLFVASGLLGLPCSFWPSLGTLGLVAMIVVSCLILFVYSYWCYQQQTTRQGREPLAPPFSDEI